MLMLSRASAAGLVVRVDLSSAAAHEGEVVVHLKGAADSKDVKVHDDGARPDVAAGDEVYSGTVWLDADAYDASLSLGTHLLPGGPVSWDPANVMRDLDMSVAGETLTASSAAQNPNQGGSTGAQDRGTGSNPSARPGGRPPAGATPAPVAAEKDTSNPMLFAGVGLGLLLLSGVAYWTTQGRVGSELAPLPEPGLVGPTTPSLSAGLSVWEIDPEDAADLADALLATLARHRCVVVAADPGYIPAAVFGGPVYRADGCTPAAIKKMVDAADEEAGPRIAVLIRCETDPARLKALVDALHGTGGVVVTGDAGYTPLPIVHCRRGPGRSWSFATAAGEVQAHLGPGGLELVEG